MYLSEQEQTLLNETINIWEKRKVFIAASDLEISTPYSYLERQRQNIHMFLFKYPQ